MNNNELTITHHGKKGMKWGVRLYQNKDGSLTPLGKIRYRKTSATGERKGSSKDTESHKSSKKIEEMSDEEIRQKINRLRLEKDYYDAVKSLQRMSEKTESRVKKLLNDTLEKSIKNIGEQYSTYLVGTAVNKIAGKEIVNPKKGQKEKK